MDLTSGLHWLLRRMPLPSAQRQSRPVAPEPSPERRRPGTRGSAARTGGPASAKPANRNRTQSPATRTRAAGRPAPSASPTPLTPAPSAPAGTAGKAAASRPTAYVGDHVGPLPHLRYAPKPDGRPDPGEIVWTRVPYQEDPSEGKDRPVLLLGWDGPWLLGCPLTSKDHDRDEQQERAAGRVWVDIGAGAWDARRRPSEAGIHRVIRIDPDAIRREGAVLDQAHFRQVVAALVGFHGHRRAHQAPEPGPDRSGNK